MLEPLAQKHRENTPFPEPPLRLAELIATFALAQDNAFGQPLESQLRSCLLGVALCDEAGFDSRVRETVYWVALLRYLGCTGHAHEIASVFADDIAVLARTLVFDAADPADVMRAMVEFATADHPAAEHDGIVQSLHAGAHDWAVHNFATGCEVAVMLVERLGLDRDVRDALRFTYERWNGKGFPSGASGDQIPLAMRIVHVSHDMEAIGRRFSPAAALDAARDRRGRTYDPLLADLFAANGGTWFERIDNEDPWDAVLALEPEPRRMLAGHELDDALTVVADFIDLKSPYKAGHSRRCAELAAGAARLLELDDVTVASIRRAALVHEFGITGVPNSIWDKPGPLTRAEFDRVEMHPMLTEQMLRRAPALSALNTVASAHHETCNGAGYHKHLHVENDLGACILAATEIYVGLTSERADRPRFSPGDAASEVLRLESARVLEPRACDAVLRAAGHGQPRGLGGKRPQNPGGLSLREVDVLQLAARGLTTQQIAARLSISPKTTDHHIQHVYNKIGVSTRGAAALWAMQHAVVR